MLVLRKAVKMVWSLPEVMRISYAFMLVMLLWMALWSFGAAGVVASNINLSGRWWLLVVSWQVLLIIQSCYWDENCNKVLLEHPFAIRDLFNVVNCTPRFCH